MQKGILETRDEYETVDNYEGCSNDTVDNYEGCINNTFF